ncbi:hypothetical protein Mlab_0879 [Methanocorpusculum labreanum Z]|uniref:DUF4350 domain-containing protein n=1 Tax=Methanocorpusculum labreanum (strain ATCC 43576 / DSM 4855 / Z) TaxID=410358 RepID=A2SRU4_METLZ|nr:DUF4350 domain-containing protein [Methanocorpusculum labreanum]ABN07050.1 hypothetical protein Mlab_0879 [Methanocorpusculum labreanum Z]
MRKRVIIAILLIIIVGLIATAQFATTDEEYSRYNINWNGTSDFFGMAADKQCVYSYDDLRSAESGSTLLIIAPGTEFTGLADYLYQGNTVIIADQSGNANIFLEEVGSSIRVHNEPVRSTSMEYKDMGIFRGTVEGDLFGSNVTTLTFNYPGYVTGGDVIASTSYLSWIDTNGNNIPDSNETLKVYSLIASENIGNGRVVVIADPSVFINSMLVRTHTENMQVIDALINEDIIIDQTNSATTDGGGLCPLLQIMHRYPSIGTALLTIILILAAIIGIRRIRQ